MTQITHNDALPGSQVTAKLLAPQTSGNADLLGAALTGIATASAAGAWFMDLEANYTAETIYNGSGSYWQIIEPTTSGSTTTWNVIVPTGASSSGAILLSTLATAGSRGTIAASGTAQTLAGGGDYIVTLTANCVFTFAWPAGSSMISLVLKQDGTGGRTSTFTAKWTSGIAPTLRTTANNISLLQFFSPDGGTTVFGSLGGDAFA